MNGAGDTVFEAPCSLWSLMKSLMDYQDQGQAAAAQGNYSHTIFTVDQVANLHAIKTYNLLSVGDR